MKSNSNGEVTGIVAVNSPGYIKHVFDCLKKGEVFTPLRNETDQYRIDIADVGKIVYPETGFGWFSEDYTPKNDDETALIMFTSGTESQAKGVLLSHRSLSDVVSRLNDVMKIDSSIREYIGIPVYHSFGFGRCRAVAAVKGKAYIPENGFNPFEIKEMLSREAINAISAVPSLWRILLKSRDIYGEETENVKWIEIGSQYMSVPEKEDLKSMFPNASIVQHYGLTEASRTTFLEIHNSESKYLDSVGRTYGDTQTKISEDGRILIYGPHVTKGTIADGEHVHPTDQDGWLTTNDLGKIVDGHLVFLGRKDDMINCGGIKISPEELETVMAKELNADKDFAVCRIPDELRGNGVLVASLNSFKASDSRIMSVCGNSLRELGVNAGDAIKTMRVEEIPKTETGKIQRGKISEIYTKMVSTSDHPLKVSPTVQRDRPNLSEEQQTEITVPAGATEEQLISIWEFALGISPIGVDESFFDLGGDSLSAIMVMVRMQRLNLSESICKRILQGSTIREIAKLHSNSERSERNKNRSKEYLVKNGVAKTNTVVNMVRGLLVLAVVFGHWSGGFFQRLPQSFDVAKAFLSPIFSFGTSGFAIVYGIGLGYIHFPIFKKNPARVKQSSRTGAVVIFVSIILVSIMRNLLMLIKGHSISSTDFFNSFFSVLLFYFLAQCSVFYWFKALNRARYAILACLSVCLLSFAIFKGFHYLLNDVSLTGFYQLIRLMLITKYSYFNMLSGVFLGIGIGIYIHEDVVAERFPRIFGIIGSLVVLVSLGYAYLIHQHTDLLIWPNAKLPLWKWVFYGGIILLMITIIHRVLRQYGQFGPIAHELIHLLAIVGQLALPFYIAHAYVLDIKNLLDLFGVNDLLSLLAVLSLFALGMSIMMRKVYRLYYS